MDLIIIIINQKFRRKKVKNYLKEIGLGDYITFDSFGTFGLLNADNSIRRRIDRAFDDQFDQLNKGKVITVINNSKSLTCEIIDKVYEIFDDVSKKDNTGIAFSIPVNEIFSEKL